MPGRRDIDISGAFADALVLAWPGVAVWTRSVVPVLDFVSVDLDAALAVDLYLAPNGVVDESRRIPIVRGTAVFHELVSCFPWWVDPVTGLPWEIRCTKAAGAALSAFVRLQWSENGGGF